MRWFGYVLKVKAFLGKLGCGRRGVKRIYGKSKMPLGRKEPNFFTIYLIKITDLGIQIFIGIRMQLLSSSFSS
jgi:hypothetical protein